MSSISSILLKILPPGFKGRSLLSNLYSLKSLYYHANYQAFLDDIDLPSLLTSFSNNSHHSSFSSSANSLPDFMERLLNNDFTTYLPNDILFKTDTTSMYHSLELRAPFLDNNVIDYASKIHVTSKLSPNCSKIPLRTIASKLLPETITRRPKQGFLPPLNHWLRVPSFYDHFKEVIYSCPYFKHQFLESIFSTSSFGVDNSSILFQLYMFSCVYLKHRFYI